MSSLTSREQSSTALDWDRGRLWFVLIVLLVAWHAWQTLTLFGLSRPWAAMTDDRPIVSGSHPLHLYHGTLGARSFLRDGSLTCYDPAFQAGYPKTPVFDSGSRPAEMFLVFVRGRYFPAAYKNGLAGCTLMVPLVFLFLARRIGTSRRGSFLTVLLGLLVWWGAPCRAALEDGKLDLLFGGLIVLLQTGFLIRYHRDPRVLDWLGILAATFLGWFLHPLLFLLLTPALLLFYLGVGARHRFVWHVLLATALGIALVCNLFWLIDWVEFWWLRMPLQQSELTLLHRTPLTVWRAELWGTPVYRALALYVMATAFAGMLLLHFQGHGATARLTGLLGTTLLGLALGGILLKRLGRLQSPDLFVPGLFVIVPLSGHALEQAWKHAVAWLEKPYLAAACFASAALLAACCFLEEMPWLARRAHATLPLQIGMADHERDLVNLLRRETTTEARILWQDHSARESRARWTTLLPLLTDRSFIGGLDPHEDIEHTVGGLDADQLEGRPLSTWSRDELAEHCRRYNVGWIVCWTAGAKAAFRAWPQAREVAQFGPANEGSLFKIERAPTYALTGKAVWVGASVNRILLRDVEPDANGEVVLSLHYLHGLRASPSRVKIEEALGETNDEGRIPFVRLRLDAPVARLTLIWEN